MCRAWSGAIGEGAIFEVIKSAAGKPAVECKGMAKSDRYSARLESAGVDGERSREAEAEEAEQFNGRVRRVSAPMQMA